MNKQLLLGAEAIAQAALDAESRSLRLSGNAVHRNHQFIQQSSQARESGVRSKWSVNEKTAYEAALGMSYAGKRALVCMKHVGLNVAADAFMNSAITGVHGGLVIVVADDPSMHSSQNEQDSRVYGKFAMLPVLEPSNQKETYDIVRYAFNLSEDVKLPVLLRIPTRLSHSRSVVVRTEATPQNQLDPTQEKNKWILLPVNARKGYHSLLEKQTQLENFSEFSKFNKVISGAGDKAVIAFGIGYNYVMEVIKTYNLNMPVLKLSQYPLPEQKIRDFTEKYQDILIAEEGYPVYEELLKGFSGTRNSADDWMTLCPARELSPNVLAKALGVKTNDDKPFLPLLLRARLCCVRV